MRVGLTYDLRADYLAAGYGEEETAEFDRPETIDALETALRGLGHRTGSHRYGPAIDRAAGTRGPLGPGVQYLRGPAWRRGARIPSSGDLGRVRYPVHVFGPAGVGGLPAQRADQAGRPRLPACRRPILRWWNVRKILAGVDLPFPVFAKPVAEGTGKGVGPTSKIRDRDALDRVCRSLLEQFRQPVLVETFLPGREFTVGVLGTGREATVLGTLEIVLLRDGGTGCLFVREQREVRRFGRIPAGPGGAGRGSPAGRAGRLGRLAGPRLP